MREHSKYDWMSILKSKSGIEFWGLICTNVVSIVRRKAIKEIHTLFLVINVRLEG